jgi:hypothetical protein
MFIQMKSHTSILVAICINQLKETQGFREPSVQREEGIVFNWSYKPTQLDSFYLFSIDFGFKQVLLDYDVSIMVSCQRLVAPYNRIKPAAPHFLVSITWHRDDDKEVKIYPLSKSQQISLCCE